MKNRKLMIIIPYFYPKVGGLENYAYNVAKGLCNKYGWDIVVVTSNHEERKYKEETIDGFKIYRLPYLVKLSNTPVNPLWYFQVLKIIEKEKPSVINGHTPVPFIADIAAVAAKATRISFVLTYQNDLEKGSIVLSLIVYLYSLVLKTITLPLSKKIIVTTAYFLEKSELLKKFRNKISVIPPGVHINKDSKKLSSCNGVPLKDRKIVLFVGSMDKTHSHKGVNYLIQAIELVKKEVPDILLLAVGKGDGIEGYKKLAEQLSVQKNILFTGFVSDAELPSYYKTAEVVVLPSTNNSEGFGMVLIEAGANKKPVIATRVGGVPYVVDHMKTGIIVEPEDSNALSGAIKKLLTNNELSAQLGANAYQKVITHYLWEEQVEKTQNLLSTL